jgi:hypothetical protein
MDWLKIIYEVIGAQYPRLSLTAVSLIGALAFGGSWWLVGRQYQRDHPAIPSAVKAAPASANAASPAAGSPTGTNPSTVPSPTATTPSPSLKTRWEGAWESDQGYRFSFVMHLDITGEDTADGYILWRLLGTPPGSFLAGRVNEPGTEFVRGSIDRSVGVLSVAGYRTDNPTLLALDQYRFFISADNRTFRGISKTLEGTWHTAINGTITRIDE